MRRNFDIRLINANDLAEIIMQLPEDSLTKNEVLWHIAYIPTAYDIDKVVDRLNQAAMLHKYPSVGTVVRLEDVKEIIKRGAR